MADTVVAARTVARPAAARPPVPATLLCCTAAYAAFSQGAFYRPQALTFTALLAGAAALARGAAGSARRRRDVHRVSHRRRAPDPGRRPRLRRLRAPAVGELSPVTWCGN